MSLINEALKKAQRQRTDATPSLAPVVPPAANGGTAFPRIVKRKTPIPARALMMLLTGGILVLLTGIVLTIVVLNLESTPLVFAKKALGHQAKPTPSPAVEPPSPPSVVLPPIVTTIKPVEVDPILPPPQPHPVAVTPAPVPTPPPAPVSVVVVPPSTPPPILTPKPIANPAVYAFLESLRITGVRVAGEDSKAIMNDRVVRLRDYVDRSLRLRLKAINASSMVFVDDPGFEYTKPF